MFFPIHFLVRMILSIIIACGLAYHGLKKNSLNASGAIAAIFVGFVSFLSSYRFGLILILFYYTSSKLTKVKEDVKEKLEDNYSKGGQRNYIQVFCNSIFATLIALYYIYTIGEDDHISFIKSEGDISYEFGNIAISKNILKSYLICLYVAHYACATADTWASELGILSKQKPRLVTTLFIKQVPSGCNGGMSILGTFASAVGGAFIGLIHYLMSFLLTNQSNNQQLPIVMIGFLCGIFGSLFDSILGATLQASYYSIEKKCIVKDISKIKKDDKYDNSIICLCGIDILSNEAVNALSILMTMILAIYISPVIFCFFDSSQCEESIRLNNYLSSFFI